MREARGLREALAALDFWQPEHDVRSVHSRVLKLVLLTFVPRCSHWGWRRHAPRYRWPQSQIPRAQAQAQVNWMLFRMTGSLV